MVCLASVAILALHPALSAGFVLVDDHEILRFSDGVRHDAELQPMPDLVTQILVADAGGGRFRPLYWVFRYTEIAVMGTHPAAWHALFLGLGLLAAGLFYLALSAANVRGLPALLASVWLLVQPGVSSVWIRLGPQESLGTVFLLLGALATARAAVPRSWPGWDWLFVVSVGAAALTKESFAIVPPSMLALRLLLFRASQGKRGALSRRAMVPGLIALGVGLLATTLAFQVAHQSHSGSYGGNFLGTAALALDDTTLLNLYVLTWDGGLLLPLVVLGPLVAALKWRRVIPDVSSWLLGACIVCLLIVPQLVLYRSFGGFVVDRYVLPSGLALVAGIAASLTWSWRAGQRALVVVTTTAWLVLLSFDGLLTWRNAESFRVDSVQLSRMLDVLGQVPPGSTIGIAADPLENEEAAVSLPYHLAARGRSDVDTRLLLTGSDNPTAARLADQLANTYFAGRTDVASRGCADLAAVVLFSPESTAVEALPCLATDGFHLDTFSETVTSASFVAPLTVGYSVLHR